MKHNIRFNIFGLFAVATALLAIACERDPLDETMSDGSDYVAVTLTIQPEDLSTATRAAGVDNELGKPVGNVNYSESHISDGTKADILVYAVYDEEGNLLSEFGQVERGEDSCTLPDGTALGEGQTLEKVTTFPQKITLKVRRNKTYKFAFWAQSSNCKAYDIHDLTKVKMHYTEIESSSDAADPNASTTPNNDELRDAFCKVEELTITSKAVNNTVIYLYRPLAQINVGSTGYDYETVVQDKEMNYAYTRIQIASAPRYLNVVEDKVLIDQTKDNYSVLEYGWALMPAYTNADWAQANTDHDWAATDADMFSDIASGSISSTNLQHTYEWEEFLRVKLYDDNLSDDEYMELEGKYRKYAGLKDNNKKTETFKYLSMCYVLAASNRNSESEPYERSSFDRVRVWIATDKTGANEKQIVDIYNVPATRNWRTNIVGNIMTTDVTFEIKLDPIYAGDYNGFYEVGNVVWSGPLNGDNGGVWYDAENDEILISNVNGLLWFQQMVNGNLVYMYTTTNSSASNKIEEVKKGQAIKYWDENNVEYDFGDKIEHDYFKGIPDPTENLKVGTPEYEKAAELKARILRATHQDTNRGYNLEKGQTWPEYNNFHFVGMKEDGSPDPAHVKLVADIDLSGIEWLGIGFDCKMDQTFDMLGDNNTDNKNNSENSNIDKKSHRGFFGHFDGNGHTVSNLKTKRFSINVHNASLQWGDRGGPYEAVQWYPRGFFGQIGGEATVENLILNNVDIYGNHCVGGIVGAAIGVKGGNSQEGTEINIRNCIVDGGKIENVPMFRGDLLKDGVEVDRTYARGVNTGGIVGLYNASGSITDCHVRNLTISGYRITGGIVGCITNYYLAYYSTDFRTRNNLTSSSIEVKDISGCSIHHSTILSDRFLPFDTFKRGEYSTKYNNVTYSTSWAYGFSWTKGYSSFCNRLVGGDPDVLNYETKFPTNDIYSSDARLIDFACDVIDENNVLKGRTATIENADVDILPVLNNWFVDYVTINSNLVGTAAAYKRYETHKAVFFSAADEKLSCMWDLPNSYKRTWVEESGAVGMRVGAVDLNGNDYVLSVRGVTGKNDCAVQISSCDRSVFKSDKMPADWETSAETTLKDLTVRGNPYAYTGICLSPNKCMKAITLDGVSVYDVYQTIALDNLKTDNGNVWPQEIATESVTLTIKNSDLRGYTTPGAGWKSVTYTDVIFETGAYINSLDDASKRNTCDVEAATTFTGCTFKAPFTIDIKTDETVTFTDCHVDGPNTPDIDSTDMPSDTKKIEIDANGAVTYYDKDGGILEA